MSGERSSLPTRPVSGHRLGKYTHVATDETPAPATQKLGRSERHPRAGVWTPKPLRGIATFGFMCVFFSILASLITVYHIAKRQNGLDMFVSNHYGWTYGPTAIFVILNSFWRLVDFHCKALAPWEELFKGSARPERSIWLDYISSSLVVTLGRAASNSHFSVALTTVGFLILKLATLASTGLFLPAVTQVGPVEVPMLQMTRFDNVSNLDAFANYYATPDPAPLYKLYGIMERGLQAPDGVEDYLLYETLRPATSNDHTNMTYKTKIRAFVPLVTCDPIKIEVVINASEYGTHAAARQGWPINVLESPGWACNTEEMKTNWVMTMSAATQVCPLRQIWPFMYSIGCTPTNDSDAHETTLLLMGVADLRYAQTFNTSLDDYSIGDDLVAETWSFDIPAVAASLCQTSHAVRDVDVFYNASTAAEPHGTVEELRDSDEAAIPGITSSVLSDAISKASGAGNALFGSSTHLQYAEQPPDAIMKLIAARADGDYQRLLDATLMSKAAEEVIASLLVQIAAEIMTYDTNETLPVGDFVGQVFYTEQKLHLQSASLFLLAASISVMIIIAFLAWFLRPTIALTQNPESIAVMATVLQDSLFVHEAIQRAALHNEKGAKAVMAHYSYSATVDCSHKMSLNMFPAEDYTKSHQEVTLVCDRDGSKMYAPMALTVPCMMLTLASAPIAMGLLEYIQHLSDTSDNGLRAFRDTTSIEVSALTRYIPGLVALSIATLFNLFDFNTIVLSCYSKMQSRSACANDLYTTLLAQLPPVAIYSAARHRFLAACLTGSAALVGSVLTIVASGLYVIDYVQVTQSIEVAILETWNTSFHEGLASDNATGAVVSLLESVNLTYSLFTFDELVFPAMSIIAAPGPPETLGAGLFTAIIPSLRAELVCSELDDALIGIQTGLATTGGPIYITKTLNATVPLPDGCHLGSSYGNESIVHVESMSSTLETPINTTYNAKYLDLHVGPWRGSFEESGTLYPSQPDNPPGCPSVLVVHAYFNGNDSSKTAVSVLSCEQKTQSIDTNVTFRSDDMSIATDHPPVPDEASARYITIGPNNETAFW